MVSGNEWMGSLVEGDYLLPSLEELFGEYDAIVASSPFNVEGEDTVSYDSYESLFEEFDAIVARDHQVGESLGLSRLYT